MPKPWHWQCFVCQQVSGRDNIIGIYSIPADNNINNMFLTMGTRKLQFDNQFIDWIKTASAAPYKISVCTGSLLLGAAGYLKEKNATTNYQEYEALRPYCKEVLADRIVDDSNVITAGAVSASLDLGLYLCRKWAGPVAETQTRKRMDYRV
jgi:cyclohexyl-isocyanide hydratase